MKGAALGQIWPWTAQIWAVARLKSAHLISSARERRKRSTPSRRSNVAVDLEIDGSPASSPARRGRGHRGRERKASLPGSSPRGGEDARERLEAKEETMACSGVLSGPACTAGVHGDGGGVLLGSRLSTASTAASGQKEEGEG